MKTHLMWVIGVALFAAVLIFAVVHHQNGKSHSLPDPVHLVHPVNSDETYVVLTPKAEVRLGIETATVTTPLYTIPYTALIYDAHGDTWIYALIDEQTYARESVVVDRVLDNGTVALRKPLRTGLVMVTIGSVELFGAEHGIGSGGGY